MTMAGGGASAQMAFDEDVEMDGGGPSDGGSEPWMQLMPQQYLQCTVAADRALHSAMHQRLTSGQADVVSTWTGAGSDPLGNALAPGARCWHFHVVFVDRPGALTTISSVLAEAGVDILQASLFRARDGKAVDVFYLEGCSEQDTANISMRLERELSRNAPPRTLVGVNVGAGSAPARNGATGGAGPSKAAAMLWPPDGPMSPGNSPSGSPLASPRGGETPPPGCAGAAGQSRAGAGQVSSMGACSSTDSNGTSEGCGGSSGRGALGSSVRGASSPREVPPQTPPKGGRPNSLVPQWTMEQVELWDQQQFRSLQLRFPIAEGSAGRVWEGSWAGARVAVKVLKAEPEASQDSLTMFVQEMQIWSQLRHPAICSFLGTYMSSGSPAIVLELMRGGSLHHLLHDGKRQSSSLLLRIALEVSVRTKARECARPLTTHGVLTLALRTGCDRARVPAPAQGDTPGHQGAKRAAR